MNTPGDREEEKRLVKSRSPIDQVVKELAGCEFESRGPGDLWACCPFHTEDTPSFHVRIAQQMFYCFGCRESGDVYSFVQKIRGIGFKEALEMLAERCGVTLGSLSAEDKRRQTELRDLRNVLTKAGEQFAQALRSTEGAPAVAYLKDRGFEGQTAKDFDVGFISPDFQSRLRGSGLASVAIDRAGFTKQFSGRLSFGIRDANGGLVGFGARTLDPEGKPKYVNTRETSAFNKRRLLYGLDKASRAVARSRRLVIMEGYTDVLMAHQQGLGEAVASMGTSLTDDHVRLLKARASNLVFVFDGDDAGRRAAERAVKLTLSEGMEVRVLCLPDGSDPGEWFLSHDAADFEKLLESEGMSTVSFLCQRAIESADHSQPGWREQVAREVLPMCRTIVDPLRREKIAKEVSKACSIDRNLLRKQVQASAPSSAGLEGAPQAARSQGPTGPAGSARIRCQFAVVAGLALRADAADAVDRLSRLGVLDHPQARQLVELAKGLGEAPVDSMSWLEVTREEAPHLTATLEKALFPGPGSVLPSYESAFEHLQSLAEGELEQQSRRAAVSRPGIELDPDALRAIQESLLKKRQPPAADHTAQPEDLDDQPSGASASS